MKLSHSSTGIVHYFSGQGRKSVPLEKQVQILLFYLGHGIQYRLVMFGKLHYFWLEFLSLHSVEQKQALADPVCHTSDAHAELVTNEN